MWSPSVKQIRIPKYTRIHKHAWSNTHFLLSADKLFHSFELFIHPLIYGCVVLHVLGKPELWLIMFEKSYRQQLLKFCGVPQSCGQPCSAVVIAGSRGTLLYAFGILLTRIFTQNVKPFVNTLRIYAELTLFAWWLTRLFQYGWLFRLHSAICIQLSQMIGKWRVFQKRSLT